MAEYIVKKIADMERATYNPRVDLMPGDHEYESIKNSIEAFKLVVPVVWNRRTNRVVSGHQRLTVLEDVGETEVTVSAVDLDTTAEKQLNIALNKIEGGWDDQRLSDILLELGDEAADTGFTESEIEVLQRELESFFDEEEPQAEEEEPDDSTGDFFLLTLTFDKVDEKALKAYVKKNGPDEIVGLILATVNEE